MSNDTQRRWTKADAEDASRLLAEQAKRAEKASGGFERPEKIQDSTGVVPAVPVEKAGSRSARGGDALHGFPQPVGQAGEEGGRGARGGTQLTRPTATRMGGDERSGFLIADNDNFDGQIFRAGKPRGDNQTARPIRDVLAEFTDRDFRRSRVVEF